MNEQNALKLQRILKLHLQPESEHRNGKCGKTASKSLRFVEKERLNIGFSVMLEVCSQGLGISTSLLSSFHVSGFGWVWFTCMCTGACEGETVVSILRKYGGKTGGCHDLVCVYSVTHFQRTKTAQTRSLICHMSSCGKCGLPTLNIRWCKLNLVFKGQNTWSWWRILLKIPEF